MAKRATAVGVTKHLVREGDARDLTFIPTESVHLVCTSPPYGSLKTYPDHPHQIGNIAAYEVFLDEMDKVWAECLRILVPGGRIACVVGDVCISRRVGGRHHVLPLSADLQVWARKLGFDCLTPIRCAALAVPRAAQRIGFQLHQAFGGKADHLAQECRVGALLQKLAKGDPVVGHRGDPRVRVACRNPTLLRIAAEAADRPACARLVAVAPAGRSAASYTTTRDTTFPLPVNKREIGVPNRKISCVKNVAITGIILLAALCTKSLPARGESAISTIESFGLNGTWSPDCVKDVGRGGFRIIFGSSMKSPLFPPGIAFKLQSAVRVTEDKIKIIYEPARAPVKNKEFAYFVIEKQKNRIIILEDNLAVRLYLLPKDAVSAASPSVPLEKCLH